jgi:hypothetical protein
MQATQRTCINRLTATKPHAGPNLHHLVREMLETAMHISALHVCCRTRVPTNFKIAENRER